MIRVIVQLESAITGDTTVLGQMCIANTGEGTHSRGNYSVAVLKKNRATTAKRCRMPDSEDVLRKGVVNDYPRLAYSVWRLVMRALKSAFPEEKCYVEGHEDAQGASACIECE